MGCAAGCAVASDSCPPRVVGRCGGYCRAAASRVPVPLQCWPAFGLTWSAGSPCAGPLEQTAVLLMGSIRGSRCFGASPLFSLSGGGACLSYCTCLLVKCLHLLMPVLAPPSVSTPPWILLPGSVSRKPTLFQKNWRLVLDSARVVCAYLLSLLFCLLCSPQMGGRGRGRSTWQGPAAAVSRLGLDVHSLSFTELKHCFAVLYL